MQSVRNEISDTLGYSVHDRMGDAVWNQMRLEVLHKVKYMTTLIECRQIRKRVLDTIWVKITEQSSKK